MPDDLARAAEDAAIITYMPDQTLFGALQNEQALCKWAQRKCNAESIPRYVQDLFSSKSWSVIVWDTA